MIKVNSTLHVTVDAAKSLYPSPIASLSIQDSTPGQSWQTSLSLSRGNVNALIEELRPFSTFAADPIEITGDGIPRHSVGLLVPSAGPVCPSPEWQAEQLARLVARVYAAGIAEGKRQVREALGLR